MALCREVVEEHGRTCPWQRPWGSKIRYFEGFCKVPDYGEIKKKDSILRPINFVAKRHDKILSHIQKILASTTINFETITHGFYCNAGRNIFCPVFLKYSCNFTHLVIDDDCMGIALTMYGEFA